MSTGSPEVPLSIRLNLCACEPPPEGQLGSAMGGQDPRTHAGSLGLQGLRWVQLLLAGSAASLP